MTSSARTPLILSVTDSGAGLAARLSTALDGELSLDRPVAETLRRAFSADRPIVLVGAAGIAIRILAPLIADKRAEPPVVVVAEDGSAVVPLLGGHRGANDLARSIGIALGIPAAITTASDVRFGIALDDPPEGWTLANPDDHKAAAKALLDGASARVEGHLPWLLGTALPLAPDGSLALVSTVMAESGGPDRLIYHPRSLAVGVGCERGCDPDELWTLVESILSEIGLAHEAVGCVVSIDVKMDEPAVHAVAERLGVPARFFDAATLEAETPRLANPSLVVFREVGCHGVSEGAALAAVGTTGQLMVEKRRSTRATCAIGAADAPLNLHEIGRKRGGVSIVGLGPGSAEWRTPEADTLILAADDLVAYGLYLDLAADLGATGRPHRFDLGEEEARARAALELAAEGRHVALISSGDPGIYAMATLVFELLDRTPNESWRRIEVRVAPGISAIQAAAARIGAPIGHDFCTISLSDLLTPWEAIEKRIQAAAEGDFVVAFYNPVSRRRRTQLHAAQEILLRHRPADTPVVLARSLGRPEERLQTVTLAELDPETVDMLTLVLVGSSATRRVARGDGGVWVYTPRGYAGKAGSSIGHGPDGPDQREAGAG
jgi:cobalt-precorrin 5A hydrolase / precorrin-3B C17-methyltransferase